jgi:hypothetical protein
VRGVSGERGIQRRQKKKCVKRFKYVKVAPLRLIPAFDDQSYDLKLQTLALYSDLKRLSFYTLISSLFSCGALLCLSFYALISSLSSLALYI